MFQYTEATLIAKPVIYISLQEIVDTHQLLLDNIDSIAPDKKDKLRELLADLVFLLTCHCLLDFSWLVHALSLLQMSDTPHWPCLRMLVLGMAPSGLQRSKNESLSISWVYLFLH